MQGKEITPQHVAARLRHLIDQISGLHGLNPGAVDAVLTEAKALLKELETAMADEDSKSVREQVTGHQNVGIPPEEEEEEEPTPVQ